VNETLLTWHSPSCKLAVTLFRDGNLYRTEARTPFYAASFFDCEIEPCLDAFIHDVKRIKIHEWAGTTREQDEAIMNAYYFYGVDRAKFTDVFGAAKKHEPSVTGPMVPKVCMMYKVKTLWTYDAENGILREPGRFMVVT